MTSSNESLEGLKHTNEKDINNACDRRSCMSETKQKHVIYNFLYEKTASKLVDHTSGVKTITTACKKRAILDNSWHAAVYNESPTGRPKKKHDEVHAWKNDGRNCSYSVYFQIVFLF